MNCMAFHLLYQFTHRFNLYFVHICGRRVVQFRFLLGNCFQNIFPFFHMVFSLHVQTFLLKIQKVNNAVEIASFWKAKKNQTTANLIAKFSHGIIALFYDPVSMGSLGFEWSDTMYIKQLCWPQQLEICMFGKCCICSN